MEQAGGAEHDPQHGELGHGLGEVLQGPVITEIQRQVTAAAAGAQHGQAGGAQPQLIRQGPTDSAMAHDQGLTTPAAQITPFI